MKLLFLFSFVSFFAVCSSLSGGKGARGMKYSFYAKVITKMYSNDNETFEKACGGAIISENVILTAASCLYDENQGGLVQDKNQITVYTGDLTLDLHDEEDTAQNSSVRLYYDAGYKNPSYVGYNLAALILEEPLELKRIARRKIGLCYRRELNWDKEALGLGKKLNSEDGYPGRLQKLSVIQEDWKHCNYSSFRFPLYGTPENSAYCFIGSNITRFGTACEGDFGDPVVQYAEYEFITNTPPCLHSVVAHISQNRCKTSSIFAAVNTAYHRAFIKKALENAQNNSD